jgi:hypothetical protein
MTARENAGVAEARFTRPARVSTNAHGASVMSRKRSAAVVNETSKRVASASTGSSP